MVPSRSPMQVFSGSSDAASSRPSSQHTAGPPKPPPGPQKPATMACADVKPRLTKEQHDILESHFSRQHKPSTNTKKGFAENLGVPLDKINNWFQNRRAKVKQDLKKQINQYNMSMGIYGPPQMPMVSSQYPPHGDQTQPHLPLGAELYPVPSDMSPNSLPVQSVEGPRPADMNMQMAMQQQYDMHHSLRSIPEADRIPLYHPDAVMQSIMAATAGASYMQSSVTPVPSQGPNFAYGLHGLAEAPADPFSMAARAPAQTASSDDAFSGFADYDTLDYAALATSGPNGHDVQPSTGSISSGASPFSGAQSSATTQSSSGPNPSSVPSITSMYSGWTDDRAAAAAAASDGKPGHDMDDFFEAPYRLPQASASEAALPYWDPSGQSQPFAQAAMYQHLNASAQAVLASPEQHARTVSAGPLDFEPPPPPSLGDDGYTRRNSSTSNLATNIEAIRLQNRSTDDFSQSDPSTIAARRQKRPAALNSSTLRSSSYCAGMPSPGSNGDHTLRRIRSTGFGNSAGRVQKSNPGSAQRSPMTLTFADAAASPKFARAFSSSSTATLGQGGTLAPPTPQTPSENNRFPYWQSSTVIKSHPAMPDHSSPESLNANWSVEHPTGDFANGTPPPAASVDLAHLTQTQLPSEDMYRDTPPQSAPATQQTFPRTSLMQPPLFRAGFHSSTDLTIAQPKPSHFRRPSLPESGAGQPEDNGMPFPGHLGNFSFEAIQDVSLSDHPHYVPFAPPLSSLPDFLVHQYSPPQDHETAMLRRAAEPQAKSYIFANQGPRDFRAA